jgi:hypothetical protein
LRSPTLKPCAENPGNLRFTALLGKEEYGIRKPTGAAVETEKAKLSGHFGIDRNNNRHAEVKCRDALLAAQALLATTGLAPSGFVLASAPAPGSTGYLNACYA